MMLGALIACNRWNAANTAANARVPRTYSLFSINDSSKRKERGMLAMHRYLNHKIIFNRYVCERLRACMRACDRGNLLLYTIA